MPQFITNNAQDAGFSELLAMQVQNINEITSVSEALQGQTAKSGTAASRYALETENATTAVAALIQKFSIFENEVATKKMKVIHQYYQTPKSIAHKRAAGYLEMSSYDPKEVRDIDFDVVIKQAPETPVARMAINEFVMQMWQAGAIDTLQCLDNVYMPGIEDLKASLKQQLEAVQQGQAPKPIPQEITQQIEQNANPKAVEALQSVFTQ
jgi:hypothetical protein